MPEEIKIFKNGDQTFDVPVSELDSFMNEVPDAVEVNVYEAEGKTFDVPINELDEFMKQVPGAKLKSGSKKKVEAPASGPGRDSFNIGSTPESRSQADEKIDRITADLPQSSHSQIDDPVTTLGEFLKINQAAPNDLGLATMINPELGLTQDEVDKYTKIVRNNKLSGFEQAPADFDIKPVLQKTQREIELMEMDDNDKARQYLETRVFDESVVGKILKPVIGKIVGISKEERIRLDELAGMAADGSDYAYDANMVQEVATGLLTIMTDMPVFGGIGAAVKLPSAAFGRLVGAGLSKVKASKAVISAMTQLATSSPQMAAVLGGHAFLNDLTDQVINQGRVFGEDPGNNGIDWDQASRTGGRQAVVGAMVGPVGSGTAILANSSKVAGLVTGEIAGQATKLGVNAAGLAVESAVFAYGDALVDRNRSLSDVTGKDYLHSVMTIGGLKAMHLPHKVKAEKRAVRSEAEAEAISKHVDIGAEAKPAIDQLKADPKKLDAFMNDPNVPWVAKAEVANAINGLNPAVWEPVLNKVEVTEEPGGQHRVTTYDEAGNKIAIVDHKTKSDATRSYKELDAIMRENNSMINIRNMSGEEVAKFDAALVELGYPKGIEYKGFSKALSTPHSKRTAKMNAIIEDLLTAESGIKVKETPVDKKAEEKKAAEAKREERPDPELKIEETEGGKFSVTQEGGGEIKADFETKAEAESFKKNFEMLTQGERTFKEQKKVDKEDVAAGKKKKIEPEVTKVEPKEEKPVITAETSEKYADMTEAPDGDFVFFHKRSQKRDVIDPSKSGTRKDKFTSVEENAAAATVGGVSYYYTNKFGHEPGAGKVEHRVKVPKEKVYDADADPLNFGQEAKAQYEKKFPGQGWSNNHRVFWITKLAAEKGYDITVANWGDRTRAHSVKKMTPEEGVEFTEARKEGYERQEPIKAESEYRKVLDEINAHLNKKEVYDDLYHAKANYENPNHELFKNKDALTDLVKKSDLPKELKDKYIETLAVQDVPGKSVLSGKQNEAFFTEKAGRPSSETPYEPVVKIDKETPVAKAYDTYSAGGNFTGHISKMIPGFMEKQIRVAEAIVKGGFKRFLDIGTSEGGMVKTVASQDPGIKAVGVDPNSQMKKNYESTPDVPNAEFKQEAYQGSWTEADGTKINEFKPKEKFDVVNEDFTFQFVNNDRAKQVSGVKEIMEPDGLFISSEKFHTDNKKANEAKKAEHQEKYFTAEERTADAEGIVTGMDKDMVRDVDYFNTLKDNFKHVEEFWNAGEFKGYVASDSKARIDKFKSDVGDLTTEFTDAKSKTATQPPVEGGPPAKVPPKPPKPPEKPAELPEGEGKKPERDVMDVVGEMHKAREKGMKDRAKQAVNKISYLFWDQQEPFKRAFQKSAKAAGLGKKAAQKVLDRKNVEKGSKALTAMEWDAAMKDITGGITGHGPKVMNLISDYNDMRRTNELYKSREAMGKSELLMEGGVTQKQADQFLTLVRAKDPSILKQYGLKNYDFKKVKESSDKFNEKYKDILNELKDEGIISQEAYDAINFEHPYYSPRKFMSSLDKIDSNGSMSGVEALKGGSEGAKIVDAPSLYHEALARKNNIIFRSRTMRAMESFINEVNPEFIQKAEYDPAFVEKLSKAEDGDPWIEPKFKDTPKGMENVDYIDANGNKQRFFMDAEVHKYFDIEPFGDLSRKIMHYAGWFSGTKPLKAAATGYNPEFMVKNIPIDMMHILNTTNVYSGALPVAHAQMMVDMARVAKDVVTRSGSYIDFTKEGGGMDMLTGEGRIRTGVSKHKLNKGMQAFDALEGLASWPGKSSELITRLALRHRHLENAKKAFLEEYKREPSAKELKEMQLDATAYSRNYLDFEQGGRLIKMADSVIPYLNAGTQVTRGSLRAAGKNPGLYAAKVGQLATVAGAITAWNMGLIQTKNITDEMGEEMKNFYLNDISDEVKARSFVVMTPKKYTDASGVEKYLYIKFPKDNAQELITGVAEDRVHHEVMGDDAPKYLSDRRLKELQVMTESATNVSQLPPAIRGALGYKLNKDFFYNSELWMGYDFGKDKSLEYKRDTPERYKAVGKIPLPGGHKLSPMRSHYVAKQFFTESNVIATGLGEVMDRIIGGASPELKTEYTPGDVEKLKNAPFARRFLKSTYPGASKQGSDTHQQNYNKLKQEHNLGLKKLIDSEASSEEVFDWMDSILEDGDGDITSIKENQRLLRRYKEEVLMPSVNSWVERLKYVDAVPRAQDLFDQWVHMDDDMRDHLLESAAISGIFSETTIIKFTELQEQYDVDKKKAESEMSNDSNEKSRNLDAKFESDINDVNNKLIHEDLEHVPIKDLKGKNVNMTVEVDETGAEEEVELPAVEVQKDIKEREKILKNLIDQIQ